MEVHINNTLKDDEITFIDGRKRKWHVFNDYKFFNYFCIKCEDGTYFYMTNLEHTKKLCELLKNTY